MPLRTDFLVYATLLIAPTLPLSAEVAYISDCCNNASVIGVFQTSTNKQKTQWPAGQSAFQAEYSPDGTKDYVSNTNSLSLSASKSATGFTTATVPVRFSVQCEEIRRDGSRLDVEAFD